jgi:hypothetical protein
MTTISQSYRSTQWENHLTGVQPHFRYYQQDRQHLLIVDQADSGHSALGIPLHGAGHSHFGDLLISEADIPAAGFVEISEQEAYALAETLPQTLAEESIGSHYHYGEFHLRKALVTRAMTELAVRSGNQGERDLLIGEIDSYERAIKRRWTVQADTFQFDLGLSGSELIVLVSEEGESE